MESMESGTSRRWDYTYPILILGVTLVGALVLLIWGNPIAARIQTDVFKLLAQLILITGIGGIFSMGFTQFFRVRERHLQVQAQRLMTYQELVSSYHELKRVRRLLRARARHRDRDESRWLIDRNEYDALLSRLNDVQLQCEFYVRTARGNPAVYGKASAAFLAELDRTEKYLGQIVSEWEDELSAFAGDPPVRSLTDLPVLERFLNATREEFIPAVSEPIEAVLKTLSEEVIV